MEIIGISGKAETGKDYITEHALMPMGFFRFSLAWHFKVWLVGKGLATHEEVFVTKPPHVRQMLQEEGTERGRMVYGDAIWCNTMGEWMRVLHENNNVSRFVIPDVRFPDEADFIKSLGGKVFRIEAPNRARNSKLTDEQRQHISEIALDNYKGFDGYIYNDVGFAKTIDQQVHSLLTRKTHVE